MSKPLMLGSQGLTYPRSGFRSSGGRTFCFSSLKILKPSLFFSDSNPPGCGPSEKNLKRWNLGKAQRGIPITSFTPLSVT